MDCMVFLEEPAEKEGTNHGGLLAVMILLTYHRDETAEDICQQHTKGFNI